MKNKKKYLLTSIIICYIYFLISCNNTEIKSKYTPPIFPKTVEVIPTQFNIDIVSGDIVAILIKDSLLFATSFDGNNIFQVFNKNTGKFIKGIAPRGNGPGEYVDLYMQLLITPDNHYGFYSLSSKKIYLIQDSLILGKIPLRQEIPLYHKGLYNLAIAKDKFLGQASDKRFILHDSTGKEISSYNKPLTLDIQTPDIIEFINRGRKEMAVKADASKFACVTFKGAVLELFSLKNDSITLIKENRYYPVKIRLKKDRVGKYDKYAIDKDCIVGFGTLKCTDKYIYASFYGKRHEEFMQNRHADYLYVFDWDGNPIKKYKVKGGLKEFEIDIESGKVYIVNSNINGEQDLAWFKL